MNTERPILCVVGARPNYMKIAPILRGLKAANLPHRLVHTGQHYDAAMNDQLFSALSIPAPDDSLAVGSGTHAVQTAEIMKRFEPVIDAHQPRAVLVVGDVNSTVACALVASKKSTPVIHVEAGLRSRDRSMPEEINRLVTDQLSDILFTTERSALANLTAEGIAADKIHFVGNVMIDTLFMSRPHAVPAATTLSLAGLDPTKPFAAVTLHRPSNVDDPETLTKLLDTLLVHVDQLQLLFALHPRTEAKLGEFGLRSKLSRPGVAVLGPQGYFEMLGLNLSARVILTDSGGLQEETTALGTPCITLRDNTERPITVTEGTNTLVGRDPSAIHAAIVNVIERGGKRGRAPEGWDGRAAERIAAVLKRELL